MSSNCDFFNFIVWGVIVSCLCCFGFVGNILSLLAFARERRVPALTLLQCLASSDLVLLLSVFITDSLPYLCDHTDQCANPWKTWPYVRYMWIMTPISHMSSIWFVVLIALNRYWAVCRPHSLSTVWTNQRTPIYVSCVLVLVVSFNVPRFFEYQIIDVYDNSTNCTRLMEQNTDFGLTPSYKVIYKVMLVNILLIMLPIAALIICTGLIVYGLRTQRRRMNSQRTASNKERSPSAKARGHGARAASEITFVLVVVVVVAIICQSPLAAFHFVRYSQRYRCGDFVYYLDNISKLLVNVNSCINFVIYCVASPKFRTVLLALVSCDNEQEKVRPASSIVSDGKRDLITRNGSHVRDTNL
ncbi:hypothetical protein LSH36_1169g00032 [Paralvinella palmiformis]|uniref:G-protein coupled receptors family 1 profile domain-containing protein n=1 Tax=Paralvinella palmiformis TaxID=53620 RepID=A0AAD9MRE6_9ANNE|nr:hypothetical protein LSH36_1169g00032 [Paralvinella palmiformis]